jgi:dTDP-4-dehydrorhamnose 3,5-epimerase-like enzyme
MTHTTIQAATTDDRGSIADILHHTPVQHAAWIISHRGVIRGNHYHKRTTQYLFLVQGRLRYWYQPVDQSVERLWQDVWRGDLVTTPPYEVHALEILAEATEFLVLTDGPRGGPDYESDTFRVTPILTPEMRR